MKALKCENASKYFEERLIQLQKRLREKFKADKIDLWIARSKMSLTVRFHMDNPELTYKYPIDNERMYVKTKEEESVYQERSYSHVFFMHSAGHAVADQLIKDLLDACKK